MANLKTLLYKYYDYDSFRPGQEEIINQILAKQNVLGILPTGTGKSICYELPARILPGITIVVSPLIALMIDQVKQLKANGFKQVIALNSFLNKMERERAYNHLHQMKIIFISPELLQSDYFLTKISKLTISLFVIDEAHCISTWGHDFRPDYLKIKNIIEQLNFPTVLALTATASKRVQADIIDALNVPNIIPIIYPINKENIRLIIKKVTNDEEKLIEITKFLKQNNVPTLIYFSSRKSCENISFKLSKLLPDREISFYHGGMDPLDRITIQQQFMENQLDVICCTNAFGMGINKTNIRAIFHYHLPLQKESFIQEIGRAGRDGQSAVSVLLHADFDLQMPRNIIKNELPSNVQIKDILCQIQQLTQIDYPKTRVIKYDSLHEIEETHWRFIHYHLENNDIMKNNIINANFHEWDKIYHQIIRVRDQRFTIKMQQLKSMTDWIAENNCLRVKLYEDFQTKEINPVNECCSNCGLYLEEVKLKAIQKKQDAIRVGDWKEKLAKLLFIGEKHETK